MTRIIESPNNQWVKDLVALSQKKHRDVSDVLLVEGEHLVEEAKNAGLLDSYISTVAPCDVLISDAVAQKLSLTQSGSTVFGIVRKPKLHLASGFTRVLVCDGVQDPGNVGTIIRTAYSFGFDGVFLTPHCADEFNSKTIRSSQGAIFHFPVIRFSQEDIFMRIKENNATLCVTDVHEARDIEEIADTQKLAVVIGSEGSGVSDFFKTQAAYSVKVETARFESLNAAVAAGIVCYILRK